MSIIQKLEDAFEQPFEQHAMYLNYPIALRFELAGDYHLGRTPVIRVLQCLDRVRPIIRDLFGNSKKLTVLVSHTCQGRKGMKSPTSKKVFRELKILGFIPELIPQPEYIAYNDEEYIKEFGEDLFSYFYAFKLTPNSSEIDVLIWAAITSEMAIRPNSRWAKIYFVDFKERILAHTYDDRGMDLIAADQNKLMPIYKSYSEWILHYNRSEIDKKFCS